MGPAYKDHCSQMEAVRVSIGLVHMWSTLLNTGDPDTIIKNLITPDSLLFYIPDETLCSYQPISLAVSVLQDFTNAIKAELVIKNVKFYEWQACSPRHDSSSSSDGVSACNRPRTDAKDGDVVVSAVGFMSVDGMDPSLYNVLFYLRADCGCNYQVYRQVITPYSCLATIAGTNC